MIQYPELKNNKCYRKEEFILGIVINPTTATTFYNSKIHHYTHLHSIYLMGPLPAVSKKILCSKMLIKAFEQEFKF